jgi:hypothetical protein
MNSAAFQKVLPCPSHHPVKNDAPYTPKKERKLKTID